jgi:hypothetical protein
VNAATLTAVVPTSMPSINSGAFTDIKSSIRHQASGGRLMPSLYVDHRDNLAGKEREFAIRCAC